MSRKKKPVFRLTLFFISVVFASGSILAYLSINNISNLKELTEKRIREEQQNLAMAVSDQMHAILFDLADKFFDSPYHLAGDQVDNIFSPDTSDLLKHPFIIDRKGQFLQPWFVDGSLKSPEKTSSGKYRVNYNQAQRTEFTERNYEKARQKYLSSLEVSSGKYDSVQTLNALARISVKLNDETEALCDYSTIISTYSAVCDPNGFPYAYYAIPQLIKISNPQNRNLVLQKIDYCLSQMESGKIPLNQSTQDILAQISAWVELETGSDERVTKINASTQKVGNILSFIDRNAEMIRSYMRGELSDELPVIKGKYHALNRNSQDDGELILMSPAGDKASGCAVPIEKLWSKLLADYFPDGTENAYLLDLVREGKGAISIEKSLVTTLEISPYFPDYQVLVTLKNENLIDEIVRRRSWIYGISLSLLLGGMVLGILLIMRDISREKHLSQLRADFISNVTHELKTPLTSIQLFTESILLKRLKSEVQKKEYLQIILKETESLKRMINNILDFSRREKGRREYNFKEVNLTLLMQAALKDLDYWLEEKGFSLVTEIEDPVLTMADPVALKQAIINLLNNAIKFSVTRKEIAVRLQNEGERVILQMEDKGIGIPEDQQELIFQAFYRVGQKNSEDISGTGLGLSVVKEIVEAHQGSIQVESKLNQGSTFTIQLKAIQEK